MRSKKLLLQQQQHQQEQREQQQQVDLNPLQYENETEDNKGKRKCCKI
jgi:hypothetical protein